MTTSGSENLRGLYCKICGFTDCTFLDNSRVPNYTDKKVWKDGKGRYDAVTKKHYIDQVVYIQNDNGTESFNYSIILQYYEREEIIKTLHDAGFTVIGEYCNRNKEPWNFQSNEWIVEAIKQ